MKSRSQFTTDDEYLDYLEDLIEEEEEEEEEDIQNVDELVSEADLAAMADENESSPEGETQGEGDEGGALDSEQENDESEVNEPEPEIAAEAEATTARRSPVTDIASVDASLEEVNNLLSDIDARRDKLEADWDDGEIEDRDDYKAQLRALRDEERTANRTERTLDRQRERIQDDQDQLQEEWENTVQGFMRENPDYLKSKKLQNGLREEIDKLGAEQSWLDKGNEAILYEAMRLNDLELGRTARATTEQPKPKDELSSRRDVMKGRGKRVKAPQTLGGLPAAEEAPIQSDEFSAIDALPEKDQEDAIGRLSASKFAQYMAQASN